MMQRSYFRKNKIAISFESLEEYIGIHEYMNGKYITNMEKLRWYRGLCSFYREETIPDVFSTYWCSGSMPGYKKGYTVITYEEFQFLISKKSIEESITYINQ